MEYYTTNGIEQLEYFTTDGVTDNVMYSLNNDYTMVNKIDKRVNITKNGDES